MRRSDDQYYLFYTDAGPQTIRLVVSDDQVAVGLFTSEDLFTWTQRDPIYKDGSQAHASCPQVFEQDGRWYLTLLDANTWVYRGYRITADAGADEVAIRQARTGGGTFHKRDHPVADGKPVKVQIVVSGPRGIIARKPIK